MINDADQIASLKQVSRAISCCGQFLLSSPLGCSRRGIQAEWVGEFTLTFATASQGDAQATKDLRLRPNPQNGYRQRYPKTLRGRLRCAEHGSHSFLGSAVAGCPENFDLLETRTPQHFAESTEPSGFRSHSLPTNPSAPPVRRSTPVRDLLARCRRRRACLRASAPALRYGTGKNSANVWDRGVS